MYVGKVGCGISRPVPQDYSGYSKENRFQEQEREVNKKALARILATDAEA